MVKSLPMDIAIQSLSTVQTDLRQKLSQGAQKIFWDTAEVKNFPSEAERQVFIYKYFSYYLETNPDLFICAFLGEQVYGYICGVADTRKHRELYHCADHIPIFDDLYEEYPAHLHINLAAESRGMGLGGRLVAALEKVLRRETEACGLHLVTSEGARNVGFYRKNGFTREVSRGILPEEPRMLFMGKRL
ncbi:Acetyltransferase (GNAT) family protein [Alkalispirochaeta americana]|uniref:Acetyltransferase (GNAT) family protein n=1 Tax=Alkalispirochaeta americana TaxID=159291 RepID=A0A1N6QDW9_9SPIO|nr:GNAT family N-acetyltransferase [Alkalispirochaeta americana]SIQ14740.1 Acetyltransferase (GNAT) family protein [Alkalispirochaeta americana]